jgi:SAM-dependent methyltransferase
VPKRSADIKELKKCLACGSQPLVSLFDLQQQPLANSYESTRLEAMHQTRYPLAVNRCTQCDHIQLTHAVKPDLMFKDYAYVSGTSLTMRRHFVWFARWSQEYFEMLNGFRASTVLDIGCNDGSQLDAFAALDTYGVDPASNLIPICEKKGHVVWDGYFDDTFTDRDVAAPFLGSYDVLVAQNVFAHNVDPLAFLKSAKNVMRPAQSVLYIQTSQSDMILNGEFDTIYHEHINFFCARSMTELAHRAEMDLIDIIKCPLHGKSYIFVLQVPDEEFGPRRPSHIDNVIAMEELAGHGKDKTYEKFRSNARATISDADVEFSYRANDYPLVGYGAAAKGMTFLNATLAELDFIIDDSASKQGKFAPGVGTPILSSKDGFEKINGNSQVMFVILAWNFFDEIRDKIKVKRNNPKDLFMTYFPTIKVRS